MGQYSRVLLLRLADVLTRVRRWPWRCCRPFLNSTLAMETGETYARGTQCFWRVVTAPYDVLVTTNHGS